MRITDVLRKIGVLRSGSVSWKGDASARPIEAITDDVYDRKKDFVHEKIENANQVGPSVGNSNPEKTAGRQGKVLHFSALGFGIFFLAILAASGYYGTWFWGNAVLWFGFTRYTKKVAGQHPYALGKMIALLLLVSLVSFFSLSAIPTKKVEPGAGTSLDPLSRVDLTVDLENDLGLEDVLLTVLNDEVLEVRTKTPVNVSPRAIYNACAYIFAYLQPRIPSPIKNMRIILTVNDLDAMFVETSYRDVAKWQAGEIEEKAFFDSLKIVNLAVTSRGGKDPLRKPQTSTSASDTWHAKGMK